MSIDTLTTITHYDKELIDSGSFLTFGEGESVLTLSYKNDYVYINFNIINNDSGNRNKITSKIIPPDSVELLIENYSLLFGNTSIGPVKLGKLAGSDLYIVMIVEGTKSKGTKLITYSLYVGGGS